MLSCPELWKASAYGLAAALRLPRAAAVVCRLQAAAHRRPAAHRTCQGTWSGDAGRRAASSRVWGAGRRRLAPPSAVTLQPWGVANADPGHRRRRHTREGARVRAADAARGRIRPKHDARADGDCREAAHGGLALRRGVDRLPRAGAARAAHRRTPQPGTRLGGLQLPQGVRLPGENHQRRGDAGAWKLPRRAHALPWSRHRPRLGDDHRRRARTDGARSLALQEGSYVRRLRGRARPGAARQETLAAARGGRGQAPQDGAGDQGPRAGRRKRSEVGSPAREGSLGRQRQRLRWRVPSVEGPITEQREGEMTENHRVVFLLDVDNTLLDNDRVAEDLKRHLTRE